MSPRRSRSTDEIRLHSAGGVIVQRAGGALRVAVMRSRYGTWVFPKGGVESGESVDEAASREIAEEIGLGDLNLEGPLGSTEHSFERNGRRYRKRVDWLLFEAPPGSEVRANPEENALDCGWFSPEQALDLLSHSDQKRMLRRALARIGQHPD
jgi:8-oxo-dGTP pyrophosphatase MutT (NUDIX family)